MSAILAEVGFLYGDVFALIVFLLAIAFFNARIEVETELHPSTYSLMNIHRRAWMQVLLSRENRIVDAQILSILQASARFFASGTMIAIGGGVAMILREDARSSLAHFISITAEAWSVKMFFVALMLANGFLKFLWSNRIYSYASIVMASIPENSDGEQTAKRASDLIITASKSFNRGLRMIYFSLAALCWLLGYSAFLVATGFVCYTVWRREFHSASRQALLEDK